MKSIVPHFVYTLENSLTGKIFYVGKGHDVRRMNAHEREARQGVDSYKCRVIRKIWANGGNIIRHKVAEFPEATDALIYEWFLINLIYGVENLTNISEGGQGPNSYKMTPEQIETNRLRGIERMKDAERRAYIGDSNRGRVKTEKQIEQWRQSIQQVYTPERREQYSTEKSEWWQSEEGLKVREQYRQRAQDPAIRARLGKPNIGNSYHAKAYTGFVSPSGEIFKDIHNLTKFCFEHGLTSSQMCSVNSGRRKSHQGWTKYNQ